MHNDPVNPFSKIYLKQLIMKNKLFLAFAAVLFAAITLFNVNLAQQESAGDITLAGVEMVAGAVDEDPGGGGLGFICYNTSTFQLHDWFRLCSTCSPVYHAKPNYWDSGRCFP